MALPHVPGRHGLAVGQAMLTASQPEQHQQGYVGKAAFGESPEVGRSECGLPWPGIQLHICTSSELPAAWDFSWHSPSTQLFEVHGVSLVAFDYMKFWSIWRTGSG